jgi:hypothetical protein
VKRDLAVGSGQPARALAHPVEIPAPLTAATLNIIIVM